MKTDLLDHAGLAAPPRRNGELAFDAPWQSRVFGLCCAVIETRFGGDREPFRRKLIAAISADSRRPYWESWVVALEELVVEAGLLDVQAIEVHLGRSLGLHVTDEIGSARAST